HSLALRTGKTGKRVALTKSKTQRPWRTSETSTARQGRFVLYGKFGRGLKPILRLFADPKRRFADRLHVVKHFRGDADLFFFFLVWNPPVFVRGKRKRLRIDCRIIDGDHHVHMVVVHACETFFY